MNRLAISAILLAAAATLSAAPIDEVKRLYNEQDYAAAVEAARRIVSRTPRDANANYWLGASLVAMGDSREAMAPLERAEERGSTSASELLARLALDAYDVDKASDHLDKWRTKLTRNRRNAEIPANLDEMAGRVVRLRNMLQRVERIEIVDSFAVPKAVFFESYRLAPEAGRILDSHAVGVSIGASDFTPGIGYVPQNRTEMFWTQPDTAGVLRIWTADILDDGTIDHTKPLGQEVNDGSDTGFPFLLPDGVTMYFASSGADGLGGYDIYMTSRDDDGSFMQPQNLGLPYNSPFDDYLLAIDEASGLGWWATDRNQIPDSVTVYVFLPSQMRVNVDPRDADVVSLAKLNDIAKTRKPGVDYPAILAQRTSAARAETNDGAASFVLELGDGRTAHRLSDLRSAAARSAMLELLAQQASFQRLQAQLADLRAHYRAGDRACAPEILELENTAAGMRRTLLTMRNNVVRLENNR